MATTRNYTKRIADALHSALLADEKEIAPSSERGEQRIWSVRQYSEGWLQYILMKAFNADRSVQLAFEERASVGSADVMVVDDRKTKFCCIEIKGPHGAPDRKTRHMILDDIRKQTSQHLPGCELSVFALVHGNQAEVDECQQHLEAEVRSSEELKGCAMSAMRDIKLNRERNGKEHGVLRLIVVRIPSKR